MKLCKNFKTKTKTKKIQFINTFLKIYIPKLFIKFFFFFNFKIENILFKRKIKNSFYLQN